LFLLPELAFGVKKKFALFSFFLSVHLQNAPAGHRLNDSLFVGMRNVLFVLLENPPCPHRTGAHSHFSSGGVSIPVFSRIFDEEGS
jgi:hypothetical protein